MKKLLLILFIIQLHNFYVSSQCNIVNTAFQLGEEISYELSYSWIFSWTKVGVATFNVKEQSINNKNYFHLVATGNSYDSWDWFYKVRDIYQSWIDPVTCRPLYFKRNVDEDGYIIIEDYKFNWKDSSAIMKRKVNKHAQTIDTIKVPVCISDVVSILYYARSIDYSRMKENTAIPITILLDGKIEKIYFKYLGKEVIKAKKTGKFNCLKFSAFTVKGSVFSGGENLFLWVTDDMNKIPILIEAPIAIGSVKATLISQKGLRNPQTAKISD